MAVDIYNFTKKFPPQEQLGLTNQMRRAAVSISSNLAEGFARKGKKEKIQFYYAALGSNTELQNQIMIAEEIGYLDRNLAKSLLEHSEMIGKLLSGLIRNTNNR